MGSMGVVVLYKKSFEPLKPIVATKPRPRQVPEAFEGLRHPNVDQNPPKNPAFYLCGLAAPL